MTATKEQIALALAASYRLRDYGDPERGIKPVSFTAAPSVHAEVMLNAVLTPHSAIAPTQTPQGGEDLK